MFGELSVTRVPSAHVGYSDGSPLATPYSELGSDLISLHLLEQPRHSFSNDVFHVMPSTRSKALALAFFTVAYNLVEGGVAMFGAALSDSSALLGFGLDSFVESISGMVMVWRFWEFDPAKDEEEFEKIERRAARLVGYSFFILGGYVVLEAGYSLFQQEAPETSLIGIGLAVASMIFMPVLFLMKYRLGKAIGSRSLVADSKETLACLMLSVALLIGLGTFYIWQLWWIDSVAALVIAVLIIREGFETLEESEEYGNDE